MTPERPRSDEPPDSQGTGKGQDGRKPAGQPAAEDRYARWVAGLFVLASVLSLGLFAVYLAGGDTQLEGLLLAGAFGSIGVGLGIWVRKIVGSQVLVEERHRLASGREERAELGEEFDRSIGEAQLGGRRRFLTRLAIGSGGVISAALLVPLRSLGPGPENELFDTAWAAGKRLVDEEGAPVRAADVVPEQVVTVFPEDAAGSPDAQALVIGLAPGAFDPEMLPAETVENIVCYSKICTHAGCPVGLYRARASELLCPCHQSAFDVTDGAEPVSGPAARPLPQLPLRVDAEGVLVAAGGFTEPVGPSFWNLTREPDEE